MTKIIRIPKRFYDDCVECETRTPPIVKETKRHYFVDMAKADPDYEGATVNETVEDFTSRADLYADPDMFDSEYIGIRRSASATLNAILKG